MKIHKQLPDQSYHFADYIYAYNDTFMKGFSAKKGGFKRFINMGIFICLYIYVYIYI
jgi:hypothetical protein